MKQFNLYLGRSRANGDFPVTQTEINRFLYLFDLESFTLTEARGFWKGEPEDSWILTVIGDAGKETIIRQIAQSYAHNFDQEAVYLTSTILDTAELIYAPVAIPKAA